MAAVVALLDVTTERSGATLNDRSHYAALLTADETAVLLKESFAVPTDHRGDF
jgi:hypothetical protein